MSRMATSSLGLVGSARLQIDRPVIGLVRAGLPSFVLRKMACGTRST